jgi:hypothetical protein
MLKNLYLYELNNMEEDLYDNTLEDIQREQWANESFENYLNEFNN